MFWRSLALTALVLGAATGAALAGGRATVVIDQAPRQVVAGKAFAIAFSVRPEMGARRNVEPMLRAVHGEMAVTAAPVALKARGRYSVSLTLPQPGEWIISVDSRYCETRMSPLTVKAVAVEDKAS